MTSLSASRIFASSQRKTKNFKVQSAKTSCLFRGERRVASPYLTAWLTTRASWRMPNGTALSPCSSWGKPGSSRVGLGMAILLLSSQRVRRSSIDVRFIHLYRITVSDGSISCYFPTVAAFHLKWDDSTLEKNIGNWAVNIIQLSREKRHLDRAKLMTFWEILDRYHSVQNNLFVLRCQEMYYHLSLGIWSTTNLTFDSRKALREAGSVQTAKSVPRSILKEQSMVASVLRRNPKCL